MLEKNIESILKIATRLDETGQKDAAAELDRVADVLLDVKTAQYVGSQGYWIRNQRCWSNCYRQKRAKKPEMNAQEVWQECHKEYVDSINNDGSDWDKYASDAEDIAFLKTASKFINRQSLADKIDEHNAYDSDLGKSIFEAISIESSLAEKKSFDAFRGKILEASVSLMEEAQNIASNDLVTANEIYRISENLLKESQFTGLKNYYNRFRGRGRSFENHNTSMLEADTLRTMISDLGKTLENYSHQRGLILSHLGEISNGKGPTAPMANEISTILKTQPLNRTSLGKISKILSNMTNNQSTATPAPTVPAINNPPTVAEPHPDERSLVLQMQQDEHGNNFATQVAKDYLKKNPRLLEKMRAEFMGSPIPLSTAAKNNNLSKERKSFNLRKVSMDLGYFRKAIDQNPEAYLRLLFKEVFGGNTKSFFGAMEDIAPEAGYRDFSQEGNVSTPSSPAPSRPQPLGVRETSPIMNKPTSSIDSNIGRDNLFVSNPISNTESPRVDQFITSPFDRNTSPNKSVPARKRSPNIKQKEKSKPEQPSGAPVENKPEPFAGPLSQEQVRKILGNIHAFGNDARLRRIIENQLGITKAVDPEYDTKIQAAKKQLEKAKSAV